MNNEIPAILYKYKAFSINSLDSLINDTVYLADPTSFNDPFDCQPSIVDDTNSTDILRDITNTLMVDTQLHKFINQKKFVMEYISYQDSKLFEGIFGNTNPLSMDDDTFIAKSKKYKQQSKNDFSDFSERQKQILIGEINSYLINMEQLFLNNNADTTKLIEAYEDLIKSELVVSRNLGVLSLAKNNNCPLMWAHYADDHQGFCCGYKLPSNAEIFTTENKIKAVDYEGERTIRTSQLYNLVVNADDLKNTINDTIFYVKAESWQYEKEYRMIGTPGLRKSPFILDSIYFGLRCKDSVKFSIMSALANWKCPVIFYQMEEVKGSFDLKPKAIKLSDIHSLPITYVK